MLHRSSEIGGPIRRSSSRRHLAVMVGLLAMAPAAAAGQDRSTPDLAVTPAWQVERYLSGHTALELRLSRPLDGGRERLALVIGSLDVSALVEVRGTRARYRPTASRLPTGETQVVAYLVTEDGAWNEVGRAQLKVLSRGGLESGGVVPSIDLASTGQLDQGVPAGEAAPGRRTYQDLSLRLGLQGRAVRSGWQVGAQGNVIGVSQKTQRLRFGDLADGAPALDLADYQLQVERGRTRLALGNLSAGTNRYLVNGFGSRGVSAAVGLGSVAMIDAALLNGTNVVGWTNLLGLAESAHRIGTATLNLELLPSRPGGVQIALSGMDGSVLPLTSFNQGAATDAEESRGFGVQVAMSDARQRIRFAGGLSRSRFGNPADLLLTGDTAVVAVQATSRTARFGELTLQMLQGAMVSPSLPASLGATVRHERVDPLYRSVGAYVQADQQSNGLDLSGSLGALAVQGSIANSRDNLGEIVSILTSKTRSRGLTAALPLTALFGAAPTAWYLPAFSGNWQYTRQFGEGVPIGGDFSASHVPDQRSTNVSAGLAWSKGSWNLTYRWNRSFQDNRQVGREESDFQGIVHALSLGLMAAGDISANLDLSVERQKNFETEMTQRLERVGGGLQWQFTKTTAMVGSVSQSWGLDPFSEQRTRNTEYQVELSQGFNLYRKVDAGSQGRFFVRYARTRAAFLPIDPTSFLTPRITWTLNAGASFRLY